MRDDRRTLGLFGDPAPLIGLGALALALLGLGVVWLGGTLGAWASGAGWNPPRFGPGMIILLLRGKPLWPGADSGWIAAGILALALLVVALASLLAAWAVRRWRASVPGLATRAHVQDFAPKAATTKARRLRRSLQGVPDSQLTGADTGLLLGNLAGTRMELRSSFEDVTVVIAGPRVGKTSRIVANPVLDAVGPCLVTSVRPDVYTITARHRERQGGRVWLFDPQNITHGEQTMWWDILSMARTLEGARRLAAHLTRAMGKSHSGDGEFFTAAGRSTLTNLLHAAALDNRPLADMLNWTSDQRDRTAVYILRGHGLQAMADALERMTKLAQETQDGVYEHVRQAVASLYDPDIAAWVTPQPGAEEFDPAAFVESKDTLYMLSKEGGGGASGILAALTDACLDAG
ncbi:type IV secretory system conjugative DNA transfer family protein, partial [Thermobifida halotolerans]